MIEGFNAYELYLHEKKLSLERNERKRDEERQRHIATIGEAKEELDAKAWWKRGRHMQPINVRREE